MLKLYILRHGKAVTPTDKVFDFNRKLSRKGSAQVNQVGFILENSETKIDQIISSGAKRTEETTEIINFYLNVPSISFDDDLYLTSRNSIQQSISKNATSNNLLYVGHNIGISEFVNYITGDNLMMSTSMLIQINFNFDDWNMLSGDTGTIEQIIIPRVY